MSHMPPPFVGFLKEHHVMTLATCHDDEPYCCSLFYAYMEGEGCFAFSSESATQHVRNLSHNMFAAACIALETEAIGKIQGVQIQGLVYRPGDALAKAARKAYLHRFPYAVLLDTTIWLLEPTWAKLTDNRFGFGKKLTWKKELPVDTEFLREKYGGRG